MSRTTTYKQLLRRSGFRFRYPTLGDALTDLLPR
ncbi:NAD dependent epimerase/dehydratase family enzyme [Nocardia kruczakiae]|uniref:NAD dependent epimerase/dehydratase family enzyme n=1 Tax=Nocardia kruczakiae TaxID=261477 RepID=A0ABU1XID1_9NOCA|nr:NAD dependent epimerase/dehydratase family enzyme [Nocardia kruczakiae]